MVFRNLILVTVLILLTMAGSCNKRCSIGHMPVMPYSVTPDKDTFRVGDTLLLNGSFPHKLRELYSNTYYDYSKVDLRSGFYFYYFKDTNEFILREKQPQYATDKFKLLLESGQLTDFGTGYAINYLDRNDSFIFRTRFIPLDTGTYCIVLNYNGIIDPHGTRTIDVGEKKCKHTLRTLCQTFNGGKSTLKRITDNGYKIWYAPQTDALETWTYNNCYYFFTVAR